MNRVTQVRQAQVWPQSPVRQNGVLELSARIEMPEQDPEVLWFRVPEEHIGRVTESADPFLLGILFLAMRRKADLYVHGVVSPYLLRNLEEFQGAWNCWWPNRYRRIEIQAACEREEEIPPTDRTLMTFSGGLDSCFTAWRHRRGTSGRRRKRLEAALMVHGFDIPVGQPDVFHRAVEGSRKMTGSIGLDLIPMACNIRELGEDDWEQTHGAALACCQHLLRKHFSTGLIASSHVYSALRFPWGSNPLTDPLLSSANFTILYDGGEFSRREKARAIAGWAEAMGHLRVCWEGKSKDRNCGVCVRCVGTAICFAVEHQPLPASLSIRSLDEAIRRLESIPIKPVTITRLEELLTAAREAKIEKPWVTALDHCVKHHRRTSIFRWARLREILPRWSRDLLGPLRCFRHS